MNKDYHICESSLSASSHIAPGGSYRGGQYIGHTASCFTREFLEALATGLRVLEHHQIATAVRSGVLEDSGIYVTGDADAVGLCSSLAFQQLRAATVPRTPGSAGRRRPTNWTGWYDVASRPSIKSASDGKRRALADLGSAVRRDWCPGPAAAVVATSRSIVPAAAAVAAVNSCSLGCSSGRRYRRATAAATMTAKQIDRTHAERHFLY